MKTPKSLYSRLALATSITLVVGYFVVYAAYQTFTSPEYQSGAALSSTFLGKIVSNLDEINGRVTTLEGAIAGASIWSKVGSDINYTAGKVGVGATTGNAELDIQSGIKPHWGIYHDSTTEELRFWNGDNRVVIGSTGNVGIGTTNPTALLHVAAPSALSTKIRLEETTGSNYLDIYQATNSYITAKNKLYLAAGDIIGNGVAILTNGYVGIGTLTPISITGYGTALNIAANTGATLVLRDPDTTSGYRVGYLSFVDGILTYGRAADDGTSPSPRFTINGSNQFIINTLAATYTNGSAFVCVNNNGQLYASESACP